jgi:hypothetical protein
VKGTAAGGDLGAADHPGWALAEIEAATFTNLLMLGFDSALMERKRATSFHRRMFRKTNAKGMEIVLQFLMQRGSDRVCLGDERIQQAQVFEGRHRRRVAQDRQR